MNAVNDAKIQHLLTQVQTDLGTDTSRWYVPKGYTSTALAILDSIYSTGNRYSGVVNLLSRYSALREEAGADATKDDAMDLADAILQCGGPEAFAQATRNRWRTSSRTSAPRKAEAALRAAELLVDLDMPTRDNVRAAMQDRNARESSDLAKGWYTIPGQRSGLTYDYFLMLLGLPGVKADRMIRRYVTRAVGSSRTVDAKSASRLVEKVADEINVDYSTLDHTIWRFESGREYLRK